MEQTVIQSKRGTSVLGKSERVVALLERSLGGQRFAVGDRFFRAMTLPGNITFRRGQPIRRWLSWFGAVISNHLIDPVIS